MAGWKRNRTKKDTSVGKDGLAWEDVNSNTEDFWQRCYSLSNCILYSNFRCWKGTKFPLFIDGVSLRGIMEMCIKSIRRKRRRSASQFLLTCCSPISHISLSLAIISLIRSSGNKSPSFSLSSSADPPPPPLFFDLSDPGTQILA